MRQPLGDLLSHNHRVIMIDRPGHGWSTRDALSNSTPAIQARMIDEALGKLGVDRALIVGHSWGGALAPAMAVNHPQRVAVQEVVRRMEYRYKLLKDKGVRSIAAYNRVIEAGQPNAKGVVKLNRDHRGR